MDRYSTYITLYVHLMNQHGEALAPSFRANLETTTCELRCWGCCTLRGCIFEFRLGHGCLKKTLHSYN